MPRALAAALLVAVFALAGVAYAAIPDEDGFTYVCINNSSGVMMAREKAAGCPKGSRPSRVVATQAAVPTTTTYERSREVTINNQLPAIFVPCDFGDVATGGGFGNLQPDVVVNGSRPLATNVQGWQIVAFNRSTEPRTATAFVKCQHTE